jgi:phosphotransferase system  glucose/maltose/N-acetylglucosamine-specific IIC component
MPEEVKKEETKKKGILGKMKEAASDKEEQLDILSTFVRLGILVWSGGILTLAYIQLPPVLGMFRQQRKVVMVTVLQMVVVALPKQIWKD